MAEKKEADKVEKQKRVYQISLLISRKPMSYILDFVIKKWGISRSQAYYYVRLARQEWQKYFEKVKKDGMAYHVNKRKEIRDLALNKEDYRTALEADRDEAKLLGVYPAEKHQVEERKVIVVGADEEDFPELPEEEEGEDKE